MEMNNLSNLEQQIEYLILSRQQLKSENLSLQEKLIKLSNEQADLLDKNKRAAEEIKRLISQLRNEL